MTQLGVGWIVQVQIPDTATESAGAWLSWTQWKDRDRALQHVASMLKTGKYQAGRIVRVDWTVTDEVEA